MIAKLKEFLFQNKNSRQTFTKNIFWLSLSQIGSRLIRAIIIIYAARALGAAEYGIFAYILGFATFFLPFVDMGVNSILTREVANRPEKREEYFSTAFLIKSVLLILSTLIVVFIAPHLTNIKEAARLLPWVGLLVIFDGFRDFGISYLRGLERMEKEAFVVIAMNILITASGFIALAISRTAEAFLISYIVSVGIAAIMPFIMIKGRLYAARLFELFRKELAYEILAKGWPIAISSLLGISMLNIDVVMLGWWGSAQEIGFYSAGQRVAQILYTLPALVSVAVFPTLSRLVREGESKKRKMLNEKIITTLLMAAVPLTIGGIILARPITEFLFGAEYLPTVPVFQILTLTFMVIFPGIFISYAVIAYDKQKETLFYVATGSIANVVFNALLIPSYGAIGSSIATVVAQVLSYGLTWMYLKKMDDFRTLPYIKNIIMAGIIMGAASYGLSYAGIHVLATIAASGLIYLSALYLLKEPTLTEMKSLIRGVR